MNKLNSDQISGQVLDHHGLVAAMIEKLDLIEKIDRRLPVSSNKGAKATMGQRVAAMILNGLGFTDDRLYMFSEFLGNKPVNLLLGESLTAADFNDDVLGRALDALYAYGTTKLLSELAFEIGQSMGLLGRSVHIDTTTLSLYGNYENVAENGLVPNFGYSKQNRMDLKQVVLLLATSGQANLPIWMAAHNGNASDQKTLKKAAERIQSFAEQIKDAPSFIFVADSAMYESCLDDGANLNWLSRVPERIGNARLLVQTPEHDITWQDLDDGYRIAAYPNRHKDVEQRWLLVYSQKAFERESKTLDRRIDKEQEEKGKALWHLTRKTFQCEADAATALHQFTKTLKYHQAQTEIYPLTGHKDPGRPKKDSVPTVTGYRIAGLLHPNAKAIETARCSKGRFILATNVTEQSLSDKQMLIEYKAQSQVETGFKFIKNDAFELDSIFLKKPERIEALMMVMTLCLMVYNIAQHHLRQTLKEKNESVLNQLKKPTQTPSMAWIFRQFHGVQVWCIDRGDQVEKIIVNVKAHLSQIVRYFGRKAMEIYSVNDLNINK